LDNHTVMPDDNASGNFGGGFVPSSEHGFGLGATRRVV